jgi:hypothetical protein
MRWQTRHIVFVDQVAVLPALVFSEELAQRKDAIVQVRREYAYHVLRQHLETAVNLAETARSQRADGHLATTRPELIACKKEIERVASGLQGRELAPVQDFAKQAAQAVATGDFATIQRHYWWCVAP